jgi:hypothetical protein
MINGSKTTRRLKGTAQLRKEKRAAGEFWGYDVWIRQEDGSRKRYREFTFPTKAEAAQALAALRTAGWKARYGLKPAATVRTTSVKGKEDTETEAFDKLVATNTHFDTWVEMLKIAQASWIRRQMK